MVAQFPAESSSNSSAVDSLLIPKLDIFVNINDVQATQIIYNESGTAIIEQIPKASRVVEIKIRAKGIQVALIQPAIVRIFAYATNAANNDMNITLASEARLPLSPYSQPTDNPKVNINIDVDRTKRDKTVDLEIIILNLKADFMTQTFDRVSTYLEEAVTTDLNPSI